MSAMIYYEELLYLFIYMCMLFTILTCMSVSVAIVVWCVRRIKGGKEE